MKAIALVEKEKAEADTLTLEFELRNGKMEKATLRWGKGNSAWEHPLTSVEVAALSLISGQAVTTLKLHMKRWDAVNASIANEGGSDDDRG